MKKFILGLAGLLLGWSGIVSAAVVLTTADVSGHAGGKVTVVLYEDGLPQTTSIDALSLKVSFDSTHLGAPQLIFGALMSQWSGIEGAAGPDFATYGVSPADTPHTLVLTDKGSLIGVEFTIQNPFPESLPFTTQVTFSCFEQTPGSDTCLDVAFDPAIANVTILPHPVPTPGSVSLTAGALTILWFMQVRRQRMRRARKQRH